MHAYSKIFTVLYMEKKNKDKKIEIHKSIHRATRDLLIDIYHCSVRNSSRLFGDFPREIQACMKNHTTLPPILHPLPLLLLQLQQPEELGLLRIVFEIILYIYYPSTYFLYTEQCVRFRIASLCRFASFLPHPFRRRCALLYPAVSFIFLFIYFYVLQTICIREKRQSTATRTGGRGPGDHLAQDSRRRIARGKLEKKSETLPFLTCPTSRN